MPCDNLTSASRFLGLYDFNHEPTMREGWGYGYFLAVTLQNEVNMAFKVRAIFSLIARQKAFYR